MKANDLFKTMRNGFWKYVYAIEMYLSVLICATQRLWTIYFYFFFILHFYCVLVYCNSVPLFRSVQIRFSICFECSGWKFPYVMLAVFMLIYNCGGPHPQLLPKHHLPYSWPQEMEYVSTFWMSEVCLHLVPSVPVQHICASSPHMVDWSSITQQMHCIGLPITFFVASNITTSGHVADIRVGRITSLSLLVLSHPRRGNAGHHSHPRHWSCWTRTLNGTHIPQVRIRKGPSSSVTGYRILTPYWLPYSVLLTCM